MGGYLDITFYGVFFRTIVTQVTVTSGNENLSLEELWNETPDNIKDQALPYEIYKGKVSPIQQVAVDVSNHLFPSLLQ